MIRQARRVHEVNGLDERAAIRVRDHQVEYVTGFMCGRTDVLAQQSTVQQIRDGP